MSFARGVATRGAFALFACSGVGVRAQTVVPPNIQAQLPTREEVTRPELTPVPPRASHLTVDDGIQRAPCALASDRFADVTIEFKSAVFHNLHGVSADILRPSWEAFVGRKIPMSSICEIRDAAATALRDKGYLAAVQVPPQSILDGVVHFDVLIPKLVAIHVRGQVGRSAHLIQAYLEKMIGREAFNEHDAERYLLLTRDLPGYDVRLTLRPADDGIQGDVVGEVSVIRQRYAVDLNIQDYGSRSVGRIGGLLHATFYDLLGAGDQANIGFFSTSDFSEQQIAQAGYSLKVGGSGLGIGGNFTYAWTKPSLTGAFTIRSRTLVGGLNASYPILRSQAANLATTGGIDLINQDLRFNGLALTRDHIRALYARLNSELIDPASAKGTNGYSAAEPRWRLTSQVEARQGINVADATRACALSSTNCGTDGIASSRPGARPRGTIFRANFEADWRPRPLIALVASGDAQYAHGPLLQYDQFSGGTYTIGRGYDPGTITGDKGVGISGEARYGTLVPRSAKDIVLEPYAFVDAAWTERNRPTNGLPQTGHLISAGGGMRLAWGQYLRADLVAATPVGEAGGASPVKDTRILFSVTTRLLPWLH